MTTFAGDVAAGAGGMSGAAGGGENSFAGGEGYAAGRTGGMEGGGVVFEALKDEVERGRSEITGRSEAGSEFYSQRGSVGVDTPRSGSFSNPLGGGGAQEEQPLYAGGAGGRTTARHLMY
jgi:hypothetical protein